MSCKSLVTRMPDKSGAFLRASRIIAKYGGNIVRVSYNKAVDPNTLFLDIEAGERELSEIERELLDIGYLNEGIAEIRVMEISVQIPHRPGAALPVLEILSGHNVNISYLNLSSDEKPYQDFRAGLLIEEPALVKTLLDEISAVYRVDVVSCDSAEENLDNTVFYIRLANDMRKRFGLSDEKTKQFIAESNRILQALQAEGEDAGKVFRYIRRFADYISANKGAAFKAAAGKISIGAGSALYAIQPPCGSNTFVLDSEGELAIIDTGFAVFAEEMMKVFISIWPDFERRPKKIYITHADVDHCGLLSRLRDCELVLNKKSAESLRRQASGLPDFRESSALGLGYSKISQIVSGYTPPEPGRFTIIDSETPEEHEDFLKIGSLRAGELDFEILESSGGHLKGEMIYLSREHGIIFTGDLLINISGFSPEIAEFNSFAPYLMKSVNIDSKRASEMRKEIIRLAGEISAENNRPCIICCGHGPVSELAGGGLRAYNFSQASMQTERFG